MLKALRRLFEHGKEEVEETVVLEERPKITKDVLRRDIQIVFDVFKGIGRDNMPSLRLQQLFNARSDLGEAEGKERLENAMRVLCSAGCGGFGGADASLNVAAVLSCQDCIYKGISPNVYGPVCTMTGSSLLHGGKKFCMSCRSKRLEGILWEK